MAELRGFVPLRRLVPWPHDLFRFADDERDGLEIADCIGLTSFDFDDQSATPTMRAGVALLDEVSFELPGLDAVSLVLGAAELSVAGVEAPSVPGSEFDVVVRLDDPVSFTLEAVSIAVRIRQDVVRPVKRDEDGKWVPIEQADGSAQPFEIRLPDLDVVVEADGDIQLGSATPAISIGAFTIGETGLVVEADTPVSLHLSRTGQPPPGQSTGWRGVYIPHAAIHLPHVELPAVPAGLEFTNCCIGSGGFSGTVDASWAPGAVEGTLFGVTFRLVTVKATFDQSTPVEMEIAGELVLPFFEEPIGVELAVALNGAVTVGLAATQPPNVTYQSGLIELEKQGLLELVIDGIDFALEGGVFTAKLSGAITPLVGDLDWPTFAVKELAIDSQGNVRVNGGWLDLPAQYALDFYGFTLEITKVGFGKTEDGANWIGFSGGVKLVDALPAGASVEGLRITWTDDDPTNPSITLNGAGVEFGVPEVVEFKGAVSYSGLLQNTIPNLGVENVYCFDGVISLGLPALGLELDATLVFGSASGARGSYSFFAIYLAADLPAGIPLWSTGLALYGAAGLFALRMEPNRKPDEKWYGVGPSEGWYKRGVKPGVTDLKTKWDPSPEAIAFGAGITVGTLADNGFTFAGRALLVIVLPGPIIMVEGKANLLKERASLADEPMFRSIAILDGRAGFVTVGLDAHYLYDAAGGLIDIQGGVEAFYDFHDADAWHIYLGEREPRERRVHADMFQLFPADGYLMLDSRRLEAGAWVGYDDRWTFGPLGVTLEAWLEGGAILSFKPAHFSGSLWLHGSLDASVFGFGFTLVADATCEADVFDPLHILFNLRVQIDLPWFLPDFDVDATLEWGPQPTPPPLPLPLKEIAVEHFKVTTKWPLPRGGTTPFLLPSYDPDGDGFRTAPASTVTAPTDLSSVPVVPLDARPHLTFGRTVHDVAKVGVNPQPILAAASPAGWEWLGDPALNQGPVRARFSLTEVALQKRVGTGWQEIACSPPKANVAKLFGSWAPIPQLPSGGVASGSDPPVANVKLWLWSRTPFDYTGRTSHAWDEWFTDRFDSYPCVSSPPDREVCCGFESVPLGTRLTTPWTCPGHPEVVLEWTAGAVGTVTALAEPVGGRSRALCFPGSLAGVDGTTVDVAVTVRLPRGGKGVRITAPRRPGDEAVVRTCVDFRQHIPGAGPNPREQRRVEFLAVLPSGLPAPQTHIVPSVAGNGLDCAARLEIRLACPAEQVEALLVSGLGPATVEAYDRYGQPTGATHMQNPPGRPERLTLTGRGITRVVVVAPQGETQLVEFCYACPRLTVTGVDGHGDPVPAGSTHDDVFVVVGGSLAAAELTAPRGVCITEVCVTVTPEPGALQLHEEMTRHLVDELARWSQVGEVLEPHTIFRLKVVTTIEVQDWAYEHAMFPVTAVPFNGTRTQEEYGYFQTKGPPGLAQLAVPVGTPDPATFATGLEDLTRYVFQTVPATVPAPGEKPPLPRPVYRAYDVGVRFNEDYVGLLYRVAGRDLGLYLYDNNNQPTRDAEGRLIVLDNRWGKAEQRTLSDSEMRWLAVVNASTCATLDETILQPDRTLGTAEGTVLDPDAVHEGRLVPLLLHDDFTAELAPWDVIDEGDRNRPSAWLVRTHAPLSGASATLVATSAGETTVKLDGSPDSSKLSPAGELLVLAADTGRASHRYRIIGFDDSQDTVTVEGTPKLSTAASPWEIPGLGALVQTSNINGGTLDGRDPVKPGTMLIRGDPTWTDYRLSVVARSSTGEALGVVFRYSSTNNYYRYSMDRELRYRRLVKVVGGKHTVLGDDNFSYRPNWDYVVTVEAIGDSLRVYQDGELVFGVTDASLANGRVGLYCWGNAGARFADLRVDDFGKTAPVVYRFKFTTSRFVDFFHHVHSYQDETWRVEADVSTLLAKASPPPAFPAVLAAPSDNEVRVYDSLADQVLGAAASANPPTVRVTRIDHDGTARAFLVESPEPLDWRRTSLEVLHAGSFAPLPRRPASVKLTGATFSASQPNEESVAVLLREAIDITGWRIERRALPGALTEPSGDPILFSDSFDEAAGGVLFGEDFGPNALDHYTKVDEDPPGSFPSDWKVANGRIEQRGDYRGGLPAEDPLPKRPGTIAVANAGPLADSRLAMTLRSDDWHDIGVVFRYRDDDNYYRFSISRFVNDPFRRLVKKIAGVVSVLWQDQVIYDTSQPCQVVIGAHRDRLVGHLDGVLLFNVRDPDIGAGKAGLYCWGNSRAYFEAFRVESLASDPVLWEPGLVSLNELAVIDQPSTVGGPSQWTPAGGVLTQSSAIRNDDGAWVRLPGGAQDIGVGADGSAWVIGMDPAPGGYGIHRWNGTDWEQFDGAAVRIDVGPDGNPWVVNESQELYRWSGAGWEQLPGAGSDIGVGGDGSAWVIGVNQARGGYGIYHWNGTDWERFDGAGVRIDVGPDGNPWVVNESQELYRWSGTNWEQLPGAGHDIGVGGDGSAWMIGVDPAPDGYGIHRWDGTDWEQLEGGGVAVSVDPYGIPWVVDDRSSIKQWNAATVAKPGTLALGGSSSWEDIELSVRLRSDDEGAIGAVFRYRDDDNYYRFSMDRRGGYRRLVKTIGGSGSELWSDQVRYTVGTTYELTLRAVGSELSALLDGRLLFTVYDGDLRHGRVGFYCSESDGARFERVVVLDRVRRIGRWTISDEGTEAAPSRWQLGNGSLAQLAAIGGGTATAAPGTQAVTGDPRWTDHRVTVRLRSDDGAVGVLFRYVDADNYYRMSLDHQTNEQRLIKKVDGTVTILWQASGSYPPGEPVTIVAQAVESRLAGFLGDRRLFELTDDAHPVGRIGLYCRNNPTARFDWVEVRRPPLEAYATFRDHFSTGDLNDWSSVDVDRAGRSSNWETLDGGVRQSAMLDETTYVAGELGWDNYVLTAALSSTVDGTIGLAFRRADTGDLYRFTMNRAQSRRQLVKEVAGRVQVLWEAPTGYEPGRTYDVAIAAIGDTLRGYLDGVPAFVTRDGSPLAAGSIGLYCATNDDARFARVHVHPAALATVDTLLYEPFELLVPGRWQFVDQSRRSPPGQWAVSGGELQQTSTIHSGDPADPIEPGTCAVAGDPEWTDYRLAVRLRSDRVRWYSGPYGIGVLFRYVDPATHCRVSIDFSRATVQFVKRFQENETELWRGSLTPNLGRDYMLVVDCVGPEMRGWLDGVPLFDVVDEDMPAGRIGLHCWANPGARFSEVRVSPPTWVSYVAFGDEGRLPAGTRIKVHSGHRSDPPVEESGVLTRFVASLDEAGRPPFGTDRTDLRVVAPGNNPEHARRFFLDTDYTPVKVKVLQKADGTGLVVVPDPGPALPAGSYRVKFRRFNKTTESTVETLTYRGTTDPEDTVIDIPWHAQTPPDQ